ncbi:MAG: FmdB family zinc ribbon protein [Gemmatimonadaceae bacterium]
MPTYEFTCPDGHAFENFYRSIGSAPAEVVCPVCGKVAERRLSGAGLVFKGSGFYITDYGKDGKKDQQPARASSDGESKSGEASAASPPSPESKSGTESKPSSDSSAPKTAEATAPAPKPTPAPKTSE